MPENGPNLRVIVLLFLFLLLSVRPHAGIVDFLVLFAPLLACRISLFLVRPVIVPAKVSRLLAVVPGPFPAFRRTFGLVLQVPFV